MGNYITSNGIRVSQGVIDNRIRLAKERKLEQFRREHGFIFCEDCGISSGTYFDCSHDISVKKCKEQGRTELAWDVDNITIRCRECHRKHDKI
jgi:Fe2+ or Zn2+ uptake regulation protein